MALATDSDLQASIADWLNRSDLTSVIPDFQTLAQLRINRKLSIVEQEVVSTITPTAQTTALPVGITALISVTDSKGNAVEPVSMQEMFNYSSEGGSVARYAIAGNDIYLAPTPTSESTEVYTLVFRKDMSLGNYESLGLAVLQDIYLNASLMEAYVYLKDDARVGYFKNIVDEAVMDVQAQRSKQGLSRSRIKDESIAVNGGPLA
tara:strand:+ start:3556 stop:4173 length:618 start_codon:yes stop_codon:yes gene_type:complete